MFQLSTSRLVRSVTLMLILKYLMLSMRMPEGDIYDFTILTIMCFVLTFSLNNRVARTTKLGLMCRPGQKSLSLLKLIPYRFPDRKSDDMPVIPKTIKKSSLTISSPRLTPGIHAADDFRVTLDDPLESQFTASKGFSDINHIRRHTRAVIELDQEFNFSPSGPHRLDTLSPLVFAPKTVDEIACRYSRFPLKRADNFYQKRLEQEIARLDIIVSQVANRVFTFKAALA